MFLQQSGQRRCATPEGVADRHLSVVTFRACWEESAHVKSLVFRVEPNVGLDRADSVRQGFVYWHVSPIVIVRVDLALQGCEHVKTLLRAVCTVIFLAHLGDVA